MIKLIILANLTLNGYTTYIYVHLCGNPDIIQLHADDVEIGFKTFQIIWARNSALMTLKISQLLISIYDFKNISVINKRYIMKLKKSLLLKLALVTLKISLSLISINDVNIIATITWLMHYYIRNVLRRIYIDL